MNVVQPCSTTGLEPSFADPIRAEKGKRWVSTLAGSLARMWSYLRSEGGAGLVHRKQRRLRITETVSLGEKRFVSILEVDGQAFLLGGTSAHVELLATLHRGAGSAPFERVLQATLREGEVR